MTEADLQQCVKDSLRAAGLLQYLDEDESQFLEFPDGWFAEIVIKDGSKLPEVETILRRLKADLQRKQAIELDEIVRPVWGVAKIERIGPSVSFPGLEPAVRFAVTLRSGGLSCAVVVDVTEAALGMMRERVSQTKAPQDAALEEVVGEFVKLQVSHGGTNYWDPRKDPRLELNAAAFMYLMGHRDALRRLKGEIKVIFGARSENEILGLGSTSPGQADSRRDQIRAFAQSLEFAGVRIEDFDNALLYLPAPGGAFQPGQRLPTSNRELYETLFDEEKQELRSHYLLRVHEAMEDYPDLKKEFPKVFSN